MSVYKEAFTPASSYKKCLESCPILMASSAETMSSAYCNKNIMVNFAQFRKVSDRPPKWQLFMKTTDNFCDNFDGNLVEVLLLDNRKSPSGAWVRVYVGGTDDTALVCDYFGDDCTFDKALKVIHCLEEPITFANLRAMGFVDF